MIMMLMFVPLVSAALLTTYRGKLFGKVQYPLASLCFASILLVQRGIYLGFETLMGVLGLIFLVVSSFVIIALTIAEVAKPDLVSSFRKAQDGEAMEPKR
ncbi:MAG TPA: hypothetical protein PKA27_10230 [Fimbriimonadaceae bacterium]|nr:hypothetical protein [Fimbriimonadaceae bacterium]